ncbi:alpha/beta hydrolase family protein [Haladaptatus sp. DFWS20]|uniref:alpha/beta hydrolase family protein n=1 Tax=Haladaptatus sp. DFWS20 TaxID=3403467 RepID=UPI003EC02F6E
MMDSFNRNVDGYYDASAQLPRYLRNIANQQFSAAERERAARNSQAAVERRRDIARDLFIAALGGLPNGGERTPLNSTTTGRLDRDGYVIEHVVFQSLPDFHVTSNLYLPSERDGKVPGVLMFCGHSDVGKAAGVYQQVCLDLVRNGFAVLAMDPLGQAERHQFYDPKTGEIPRRNTGEHTYHGHQCQFVGTNVARYFVWDCIRAFDYLAGRPEVDEERIAATGNSGGGMQTGYLMLADDRLAAAAPCCFVTSKEDYMKTGQAQDGEQILAGAIERGPRYDDFVATFAPKPLLIGEAQSDFICVEGATRTYERALSAYEQFDATDAIELTVSPTTHGFAPQLREAVVNWLRVHLLNAQPNFETGDPDIETVESLRCLPDGEVNAAFPEERHVVDFTREYVATHAPLSAPGSTSVNPSELRETVRSRFDLDRDAPRRFPRVISEERETDLLWEKVFFRSEEDIIVTGILVRDPQEDPCEPAVILLPRGTDDLADYERDVAALARNHKAALVFDPRGVGGVRARDVNTPLANGGEYYDTHGTEYKLAADALMLGTSLLALRTFDVTRAIGYLRERFDTETVGVVGAGAGAVYALFAAVADKSVSSVLAESVPSFRERATTDSIDIEPGLLVHDVLGMDLPRLVAALDARGTDVRHVAFPDSGLP